MQRYAECVRVCVCECVCVCVRVCVVQSVARTVLSLQDASRSYLCPSALISTLFVRSARHFSHAEAARQLQIICYSPLCAVSHEGRSPCLIKAAIGQASHQTSFGHCGISHAEMKGIGWNWYSDQFQGVPPWPTKVLQACRRTQCQLGPDVRGWISCGH